MSVKQILYVPFQITGISPTKLLLSLRGLGRYLNQLRKFRKMCAKDDIPFASISPCTVDWYDSCGNSKSIYFQQDLFVARKIFDAKPLRHIDIGSRIDGFVAHVASYRVIEEIDIRYNHATIPNVVFKQADFMKELPAELVGCCDSASCLHALEHFGLGRYGDPLNPDGHLIGLDNLWRLLKPGGKLYLSVPIGPTRIEFNSQRVFSVAYILDKIANHFDVEEFSYIDDNCILHRAVGITRYGANSSYGCNCGCGIFSLVKKL